MGLIPKGKNVMTPISLQNVPDITPTKTGDSVTGRIFAVEKWDANGFPYYTIGLVLADGSEGAVKIGEKTYTSSATRKAPEAFGVDIDEAVSLGLVVTFSRGAISKSGHPYWNVDKAARGADNDLPQEASKPRPTAPAATAVAAPRQTKTEDERRVQYMELLRSVINEVKDIPDVAVNLDVNAVVFAILKGGW